MRRALTFDIATRTGWSIIQPITEIVIEEDDAPSITLYRCGVIDLHKIDGFEERLIVLFDHTVEILESDPLITEVFYESPRANWRNNRTMQVLIAYRTIVQFAIAHTRPDVPMWGVDPQEWQSKVLGARHIREDYKHLSIVEVKKRTGVDIKDDDICDSVLVGAYGLQRLSAGLTGGRHNYGRSKDSRFSNSNSTNRRGH